MDKPILRRICGPLCGLMLAAIVGGIAVLHVAFNDSIRYSGAIKRFVATLIEAIDRGESETAHAELRRFDQISIETYEGGALLKWLEEPVTRLKTNRVDKAPASPRAEEAAEQ